jgi:hypothetical protein
MVQRTDFGWSQFCDVGTVANGVPLALFQCLLQLGHIKIVCIHGKDMGQCEVGRGKGKKGGSRLNVENINRQGWAAEWTRHEEVRTCVEGNSKQVKCT